MTPTPPQEEGEALELVQSLRDASLEDAQASWENSPQRWAARSTLLSNAADTIERLLSSSEAARGMREALKAMRARDDRNGSLLEWYRQQIDAALTADPEK